MRCACRRGTRACSSLSGGERRRVALCRLLLSNPDMLLLDEPTNHLDAESVAWLERFLKEFPGTVIAVTHDRYFLDNVAGWILELDRGHGIPWQGNYSSWLEQKEQRLAIEENEDATAICDCPKSSSENPTARNMARAGARWGPSVIPSCEGGRLPCRGPPGGTGEGTHRTNRGEPRSATVRYPPAWPVLGRNTSTPTRGSTLHASTATRMALVALLGMLASIAPTASAVAARRSGYVTILFGRTQFTTVGGDCRPVSGAVDLDRVAADLASRHLRPVGTIVVDRTNESGFGCWGRYALQPDWDWIERRYGQGWRFVSAGSTYTDMTTLSPARRRESCGSLAAFDAHGIQGADGLFAYPNNHYTEALQADPVSRCFAYGRRYDTIGTRTSAPTCTRPGSRGPTR